MKKTALRAALIAVLTLGASVGQAGERLAVIVGINQYSIPGVIPYPRGNPPDPRAWLNLGGAVNDAVRIRELLLARYGFRKEDIVFLCDWQARADPAIPCNREATRDEILDAIENHLGKAGDGDVAFFYYAGHGSRVKNSLAPPGEGGLDESIVPADAARGVKDIRDKELRDRFNAIIGKKATLTAIFDSCHSGSVSRGPGGQSPLATRRLPIDTRDVKDASRAPSPAEGGALILSATLQDQEALEILDAHDVTGGTFTIALTQALSAADPAEPAENVFLRVKALMANALQEPTIEGSTARKAASLLGGAGAGQTGRTVAGVREVKRGEVILQAGIATGLTDGTELVKAGAETPRIRITSVLDLVQSKAEVIDGEVRDVRPGDLYYVTNWAPPRVPALRVWVPETNQSPQKLAQFSTGLAENARDCGYRWVTDPLETPPTHVLYFAEGNWQLSGPDSATTSLGAAPTPEQVSRALGACGVAAVHLYANMPFARHPDRALKIGEGTDNNAIAIVDRASADYHLAGRGIAGELSYAWVRPWSFDRSKSGLPERTDWVVPGDADDTTLEKLAVGLGRINTWLKLQGPPGAMRFPYRLALKPAGRNEYLSGGTVFERDVFDMALVADGPVDPLAWQYVYVFAIDSHGKSTLLYPWRAADENRFPPEEDELPDRVYVLPDSGGEVEPPFGIDTYLMIVASEQIPNPWVLEHGPVRTRGPTRHGTALQDLLANVGARTRGVDRRAAPTHWSIQKITVESKRAN